MADQDQTGDIEPNQDEPVIATDQKSTVSKGLVKDTVLHVVPRLEKAVEDNRTELERIRLLAETQKIEKSLNFSFSLTYVYFFTHVIFFAFGRTLILPDTVNQLIVAMIASPWVGHGAGRLVNALSDRFSVEKVK